MSYEETYGKARLPGTCAKDASYGGPTDPSGRALALALPSSAAAAPLMPPATALGDDAAWYCHPPGCDRALLSAAHFEASSPSGRAAALWGLVSGLLDGERGGRDDGGAVLPPAGLPPSRRATATPYARLQAVLQAHGVLRRACGVCRWLERRAREEGGAGGAPRLLGMDDLAMRRGLLAHLRGGALAEAVALSVAYGDARYACTLSAARLRTTRERWFTETALVPLFGEYANGEEDEAEGGATWDGDATRLRSLAQFFADASTYGASPSNPRQDLDAVIGATLSGHLEVLEAAFSSSRSWRDTIWCYLRCFLVIAFTKTLINAHFPVEPRYAAYVEQQVGTDEDWVDSFERKLVAGLRQRVEAHNFLSHVKLEEQLEIRFILQMVSVGGSYAERDWFDIRPEVGNVEATRLITHLLLVLDTAYSETISSYDVQAHAGDSLAFSMAQYATHLALLPLFPFEKGLQAMVAMARRLRNPQHRAQVYAAFVCAVRDSELEHEEMTREQIEEQEARLVHMFIESDPDTVVRATVQELLNQQISGDALLTHNKIAEKILWEAMHAYTTEEYVQVLNKGLEACVNFWLSSPQPELNAITDVSRILMQRVMPGLEEPGKNGYPYGSIGAGGKKFTLIEGGVCLKANSSVEPVPAPLSAQEWSEAVFWYAFSEARALSIEHAKSAGALGVARATCEASDANRTLLFQLSHDEVGLMTRLIAQTQRAIRHGGAVVHRSRQCLAAVVWLLQVLVEGVTLSLLNSDDKTEGLQLIQTVFALLEELNEAGYLHPSLLFQKDANSLYTCIRAMRVAYGQQVDRKQIEQILQQAEVGKASG